MANSSLQLTSLDFDTLKTNFKNFLKTQSVFKDYNLEGSNMNVLLDVMSYNSYLNSFYLNMVASEMFLDSAQKYDSVVSHAKELNYTPRSSKSAVANLNFTITTIGITSPLIIPKGTKFVGTNANGSYTFVTDKNYSYVATGNTYTVTDLPVYEGKIITDTFVVDYSVENQKFILSNKMIDTNSIELVVTENNSNTTYTKVTTLYGLNSTSEIYFLQAAQNNQYEIVFGDGLFGKKPINLSSVSVSYRVTNGSETNDITNFSCVDDLGYPNNGRATVNPITVSSPSNSGSDPETLDDIKYYAPRYFATQQRAISTDDYSSLILSKFSGSVSDVNIYGGETVEPKQYGAVIVCLKPNGATIASNNLKEEILNYIKPFIALPNRVIITNPEYLYCKLDTIVQYNRTSTTKSVNELKGIILNSIKQFSTDHIEKFGADLRYSRIVSHIDNSDASITSNDTKIQIIKRIAPRLNFSSSFVVEFDNPTELEEFSPGYTTRKPFSDEPMLTSSPFTYVDSSGAEYPLSYIRDDNVGNLVVYTVINNVFTVVNPALGTIDYTTGLVKINNIKSSYYGNYISLYMVPQNKDIIISKNKILVIDVNDVNIELIETLY